MENNNAFAVAQKTMIDMFGEMLNYKLENGEITENQLEEQVRDYREHLVGNGEYFDDNKKREGLETVLSYMDSKSEELCRRGTLRM